MTQSSNNSANRLIAVIGAGLTGLTTAFRLKKMGLNVVVIEKNNRVGGQIHTFRNESFIYESGPNTGVVSYPEVAELFEELSGHCKLETAREESKRRLIWKGKKFWPLPSGLVSAISTPLFTLKDKFRILGEPWRAPGKDPYESIGALARRRLGRSFLEYAVDPFLSGVYAGDPMRLCARYAMPKLYNLEANHGSFVKGAIAKAKEPKTERDLKATKKVFSAEGGLNNLVDALAHAIGKENIITGAMQAQVKPISDNGKEGWEVCFIQNGKHESVKADKVITTVGAYELPALLPFVEGAYMDKISNLVYAPIVQAVAGYKDAEGNQYAAFGGLVPSKEKRRILGILFPSACFHKRAPQEGSLFSFFIGGMRHPEMLSMTDDQLKAMVREEAHSMLKFPQGKEPDLLEVFKHEKAIPQYEANTGERYKAVEEVQKRHPGLIIAGNLRDGIGMADRIRQACRVATEAQS